MVESVCHVEMVFSYAEDSIFKGVSNRRFLRRKRAGQQAKASICFPGLDTDDFAYDSLVGMMEAGRDLGLEKRKTREREVCGEARFNVVR